MGIEADNMLKCGCLCILSNFLNVLERDVPECEISKPGLSYKFPFHGNTMTWERLCPSVGVKQPTCVVHPGITKLLSSSCQ